MVQALAVWRAGRKHLLVAADYHVRTTAVTLSSAVLHGVFSTARLSTFQAVITRFGSPMVGACLGR